MSDKSTECPININLKVYGEQDGSGEIGLAIRSIFPYPGVEHM